MSANVPLADDEKTPQTLQGSGDSEHPSNTTVELRVKKNFVFWKLFVSLVVSLAALWAIVGDWDKSRDRVSFCFGSGDTPDINGDRERFGLCNFQLLNFIFSCILVFPFLSEALISNMVFFEVITKGNIVSKAQQERFKDYINFAISYFPCLLNHDKRDVNFNGVELLDYTLDKIENFSFWERFRRLVVALMGVFIIIPIIFTWRVVNRSFQTVFCFPKLIFIKKVRIEWLEAWRNILIIPLILCSDPIGIILLFPLSFVVIFSSQSISETIVNLVAVQVFAKLDDEFVKTMFLPARGVKEVVSLYFPDFDKPRLGTMQSLEEQV